MVDAIKWTWCCDILSIQEKYLTVKQIYKYGIIYILLHYYKSEEKSLPREIYIFVPYLHTARLMLDYLTIARYEARSLDSGSS